jgi:hypothetical protein
LIPAALQRKTSVTFAKGQSGNPTGKARGCRNRTTVMVEQLLGGHLENITKKLIEGALAGDTHAIKMILDRLVPPPRDRPINFELPQLKSVGDADKALAKVLDYMSA